MTLVDRETDESWLSVGNSVLHCPSGIAVRDEEQAKAAQEPGEEDKTLSICGASELRGNKLGRWRAISTAPQRPNLHDCALAVQPLVWGTAASSPGTRHKVSSLQIQQMSPLC